jgi:hypothetical protein
MTSKSGNKVANQFLISQDDGQYFQSYGSIIVKRATNGEITLDETYWDYSVTTGKYRNQFLHETKKDTERKIKDGTYKLANLN